MVRERSNDEIDEIGERALRALRDLRQALEVFFLHLKLFFFRASADDHNEELFVALGTA
jgi:hypothetical protein